MTEEEAVFSRDESLNEIGFDCDYAKESDHRVIMDPE